MDFQWQSTTVTFVNFLMMKGNFGSYFRIQKTTIQTTFCYIRDPFENISFFLEKHNPGKRLQTYYSFQFLITILICLRMKFTI